MPSFKTLALAALVCAGPAHAIVVNIDSQLNGSYVAGGPQNLLPGTDAQPYNAVQVTLEAGTYVITNAASEGYYSAWNFNSGGLFQQASFNWVWGFVMAEHGGKIIEDAYVNNVMASAAAMAGVTGTTTYNGNTLLAAASTAGFRDSFTLTKTTTLDFYVDDYDWGLSDNYGGVSLSVSAVPEPNHAVLLLAGLLGLGGLKLRRVRQPT